MLRRWIRRLMRFFVFLVFVGLLGLGVATLTTHYIFQEPAPVTWSRYLMPEFLWQRNKYPSIRWAFDSLEPVLTASDPRDRFDVSKTAPPLPGPTAWTNDFVGPRLSGAGVPIGNRHPAPLETVSVASVKELKAAIRAARPGAVIRIQPGVYHFSGRAIPIDRPGRPDHPIMLRAAELGRVRLEFALLEGFHVVAPFWIFENLIIEGVCQNDSRCEHAFHVVGAGVGVVIRNNWVTNFNAAVKVNATRSQFPDGGLLLHNAFINDRPRKTANPVAVLDIVAASGWRVRQNVIADFAKDGGDRTSYGAFFKGAGENNIFEQNLVRCEWRHRGGTRIGFSFGGGGTDRTACRDGLCRVEQRSGIVRNNIIMNCPNDVGIYLNKSAETKIHNNLLINTRGIDVRFAASDASIVNNIVDGRILARDGGVFWQAHNILSALDAMLLGKVSSDVYADPQRGDLRLLDLDLVLGQGTAIEESGLDFCDQPYGSAMPDIGPIQYGPTMRCTPMFQ